MNRRLGGDASLNAAIRKDGNSIAVTRCFTAFCTFSKALTSIWRTRGVNLERLITVGDSKARLTPAPV
jgi:hypothetical protein